MKRKILLLCIVCLGVCIITGCGKSNSKKEKVETTPEETTVTTETVEEIVNDGDYTYEDFDVQKMSEGMFAFKTDLNPDDSDYTKYYGYADCRGNVLVEPMYLNVSKYIDGCAMVYTEDKKVKVIDKEGKELYMLTKSEIKDLLEEKSDEDMYETENLPDLVEYGSFANGELSFDTEKGTMFISRDGKRYIDNLKNNVSKDERHFSMEYEADENQNILKVKNKNDEIINISVPGSEDGYKVDYENIEVSFFENNEFSRIVLEGVNYKKVGDSYKQDIIYDEKGKLIKSIDKSMELDGFESERSDYKYAQIKKKTKNSKYGVIDLKNGEQIIDFKYDDILGETEGIFVVEQFGKKRYINTKGEFICDKRFENANFFNGETAWAYNETEGAVIIDKNGTEIFSSRSFGEDERSRSAYYPVGRSNMGAFLMTDQYTFDIENQFFLKIIDRDGEETKIPCEGLQASRENYSLDSDDGYIYVMMNNVRVDKIYKIGQ